MKSQLSILALLFVLITNAQVINKTKTNLENQSTYSGNTGISCNGFVTDINVKVIYNALPDGYHITFTKSYISKTVDQVEIKMNTEMRDLMKDLKKLDVEDEDVLVDVISLDPIFGTSYNDTSDIVPTGYKVTQNVTINADKIAELRPIVSKCLDHELYDIVDVKPYIKNSKPIYDSLQARSLIVLEAKKELCRGLGYQFSGGTPSFSKFKDVIYPSERYLKSYVSNARLFKHHISQNSSIDIDRKVDVDSYYNLNYKNADFIFNDNETDPVIQFCYTIDYRYSKRDVEGEKLAKQEREEERKRQRENAFFIMDENGEMKKVNLSGKRR